MKRFVRVDTGLDSGDDVGFEGSTSTASSLSSSQSGSSHSTDSDHADDSLLLSASLEQLRPRPRGTGGGRPRKQHRRAPAPVVEGDSERGARLAEYDVVMPHVERLRPAPSSTAGDGGGEGPSAPPITSVSTSASSKGEAAERLMSVLRRASVYSEFMRKQVSEAIRERSAAAAAGTATADAPDAEAVVNPAKTLLPHQVVGTQWLLALFENGVSGILADEMGLGKTVQALAFLGALLEHGVLGPHLIVCPLSTLSNWQSELREWLPDVPVTVLHGDAAARSAAKRRIRLMARCPVLAARQSMTGRDLLRHGAGGIVLTTFETATRESSFLAGLGKPAGCSGIAAMIVDEAQRLKNYRCKLVAALKSIPADGRYILSGTPVQNSLGELWSVLNFVAPDVFACLSDFEAWFDADGAEDGAGRGRPTWGGDAKRSIDLFFSPRSHLNRAVAVEDAPPAVSSAQAAAPLCHTQAQATAIVRMHRALRPFMLRRTKVGAGLGLPPLVQIVVRCPLSARQREMYTRAVRRPRARITPGGAIQRPSAQELEDFERHRLHLTQLRLLCGHPYVVRRGDPFRHEIRKNGLSTRWPQQPELERRYHEGLLADSGKMEVAYRLIKELTRRGHRVLLFSQFALLLDVLEEILGYWGLPAVNGHAANGCNQGGAAVTQSLDGVPEAHVPEGRSLNDERVARRYVRLDGAASAEARAAAIRDFTDGDRTGVCLFLLSTRAGGVGLNLAAADTVVLLDGDFNPHNDVQAISRAHRIGQRRPVVVYRLVAQRTVEETVLRFGIGKLRMERVVIGCGGLDGAEWSAAASPATGNRAEEAAAPYPTTATSMTLDPDADGDRSRPVMDVESASEREMFEAASDASTAAAAAALAAAEAEAARDVADALSQQIGMGDEAVTAHSPALSDEELAALADRDRVLRRCGVGAPWVTPASSAPASPTAREISDGGHGGAPSDAPIEVLLGTT